MGKDKRISVVLFQLGGPDCLDAVEPFLFNLFSDPDIIDFPLAKFARVPLARLISSHRSQKSRKHYAAIGGKSPLLEWTIAQAQALEQQLQRNLDARAYVAMRYWHPLIESVVRKLEEEDPGIIVLLPLYPQYSKSTTGSSLNEWNRQTDSSSLKGTPMVVIESFYDDSRYVEAVVERVDETLQGLGDGRDPAHLLFSAHSVPLSLIEAGDLYQQQIEATVTNVMARGGWDLDHTLCYQSKVGARRWLGPTLSETLRVLSERGVRSVCVVPISFVSDHVETLYEIDQEGRQEARELSIQCFAMVPGLNDSPKFIHAMAEMVLEAVSETRSP
jgi:protoporphyrin/coproporphyrin ferrochelatase